MSASTRSLILNLLLSSEERGIAPMGVRELLAACRVFGVEDSSVRVALTRGVAAGLLTAPQRGCYALGPQARALADQVHRWRDTASQLVDWSGGWLAVHVGAAGRSDRAALGARERAFRMLGLAELERGLHLRPDNLAGGVALLRARLQALLPPHADAGTVFVMHELAAQDAARAHALWDRGALDAGYRDATARLAAWLDGAAALAPGHAAREAFELGNEAIRRIVFDPLLPAPLVDARARSRFFATAARFDDAGKAIWQRFLAGVRSPSAPVPKRARPRSDAPTRKTKETVA